MNIPETPREIVGYLFAIFFIGLLMSLPIHIATSQEFWISSNSWFTPETWDYILWWLNVFPEPAAGFIAIYAALALEKRREKRKFLQRVREIVPYLYFELLENKSNIEDFRSNQQKFIKENRQFNDSSWDMFKDDIKKWQEQNVVPLTRIYFCLSYLNRKIENDTLMPDDSMITKRVISASNLIKKQMETYELNYFNNEKNFEELQNVSDIYYETSLMDEDLQTQTMMRVENKQLKLVMKDRILNMLIKQLAESKSYAPATRTIQQLKEVGPISDKQVNELLFWYLDNDQISAASGQRSVLRPLFEKRRDGIHSNLLTMYDLYINRGF